MNICIYSVINLVIYTLVYIHLYIINKVPYIIYPEYNNDFLLNIYDYLCYISSLP